METLPQTRTFSVQGSAKEPYQIVFSQRGDRVLASCSCPAGIYHDICKHRLLILHGKSTGIISENLAQVETVLQWITGTSIAQVATEILETEQQMEQLKKRVKDLKKALGRAVS